MWYKKNVVKVDLTRYPELAEMITKYSIINERAINDSIIDILKHFFTKVCVIGKRGYALKKEV